MNENLNAVLRSLPAVNLVIESLKERSSEYGEVSVDLLTFLAREVLDAERQRLIDEAKAGTPRPPEIEMIVDSVAAALEEWRADSRTCRVINATGIILHSGIGRAVLPRTAVEAISRADGYVLLEVDKKDGKRRKRDHHLEQLVCQLTGAEAACVVNNNAAATMIILNATAAGKKVVVSRSQMVEIGGSFRLPDVMEMSGCILKEVGTTNRSYASDYEDAIDEDTGALMLVHTSNYRIVGFTDHVGVDEMVKIGHTAGLPVIHDLGSGALVDLAAMGIGDEPPVRASIRAGADLVCFSGDKLIGGVQSGIIAGTHEWVNRVRKNPLSRALRIDKLTAIALEATLKLYLEPDRLFEEIPTLRMIRATADELRPQAESLATALGKKLGDAASIDLLDETSETGAGSLPTLGLPTVCVGIACRDKGPEEVARALRMRTVPVFTRVKDGRVLLDPRTLQDGDEDEVVSALGEALDS